MDFLLYQKDTLLNRFDSNCQPAGQWQVAHQKNARFETNFSDHAKKGEQSSSSRITVGDCGQHRGRRSERARTVEYKCLYIRAYRYCLYFLLVLMCSKRFFFKLFQNWNWILKWNLKTLENFCRERRETRHNAKIDPKDRLEIARKSRCKRSVSFESRRRPEFRRTVFIKLNSIYSKSSDVNWEFYVLEVRGKLDFRAI